MTPVLIICIAIFVIAIVLGIVNGFLCSVLTIGHLFIAVILMSLLFPYVKQGLVALGAADMISTRVETSVEEKIEEVYAGAFPSIDTSDSEEQHRMLEDIVPFVLVRGVLERDDNEETYQRLGVSTFTEYIVAHITDIVMTVISALLVFVIVEVFLLILLIISKIVKRLPLIGKADRFLGGLLGVAAGLCIIWLLFFFLTLAVGTSFGARVISDIQAQPVLSVIYDTDPFMHIFS